MSWIKPFAKTWREAIGWIIQFARWIKPNAVDLRKRGVNCHGLQAGNFVSVVSGQRTCVARQLREHVPNAPACSLTSSSCILSEWTAVHRKAKYWFSLHRALALQHQADKPSFPFSVDLGQKTQRSYFRDQRLYFRGQRLYFGKTVLFARVLTRFKPRFYPFG